MKNKTLFIAGIFLVILLILFNFVLAETVIKESRGISFTLTVPDNKKIHCDNPAKFRCEYSDEPGCIGGYHVWLAYEYYPPDSQNSEEGKIWGHTSTLAGRHKEDYIGPFDCSSYDDKKRGRLVFWCEIQCAMAGLGWLGLRTGKKIKSQSVVIKVLPAPPPKSSEQTPSSRTTSLGKTSTETSKKTVSNVGSMKERIYNCEK